MYGDCSRCQIWVQQGIIPSDAGPDLKTTLILFFVYLAVLVIVNRNARMPHSTVAFKAPEQQRPVLSDIVSVGTWNLGYAGLGRESDFIVDGGKTLLPQSGKIVEKNLAGIQAVAQSLETDVQFFQEVSEAGALSRWRSSAKTLKSIFVKDLFWFRKDIATKLLPWPLKLNHGTAIATKYDVISGELVPIVGEPNPIFGMLRRRYGIQALRMQGADTNIEWMFLNIHLSAFDDGGDLRREQIKAVFDYAQSLYAQGMHVVVGGDWNMELFQANFPHRTLKKDLFWIHPMPADSVPADWKIAVDTDLPTVRTVNQPFERGENYLTIIDGFIVSPNVEIVAVKTVDTDFDMSDHMPVVGRFKARRSQE